MEEGQSHLTASMKFIGRAIGFTTALIMMIMLIGGGLMQALEAAGILLGVIGGITIAGCILSFWRERLGILVLLLVAIGLGIHIGIYADHNQFVTWLILGLPYLTAATLLLLSWWLEHKDQK